MSAIRHGHERLEVEVSVPQPMNERPCPDRGRLIQWNLIIFLNKKKITDFHWFLKKRFFKLKNSLAEQTFCRVLQGGQKWTSCCLCEGLGSFAGKIWGKIIREKYFSCCMNLFRVFCCFFAFAIHTFVQCARVLLHICSKSFKTLAMAHKWVHICSALTNIEDMYWSKF